MTINLKFDSWFGIIHYFLLLILAIGDSDEAIVSHAIPVTTKCEFYNATSSTCNSTSCDEVDECGIPSDGKRNHCFVLWSVKDGKQEVKLKGCFLNSENCYNKTQCVETSPSPKNDMYYCCCEGDLCNANFSWDPLPTKPPPPSTEIPIVEEANFQYYIIGAAVLIIVMLAVGVIILWTRKNKHYFSGLPTSEPQPMIPPSPILENRPIHLVEVKARGRFGAVWKATFKSEEVAVKIFPVQDKQSWQTEQDIFLLPHMRHSNILSFIGAERRGEGIGAQLWLITAYHEHGSLCDYLKAHTLTWAEACKIAETMARGLHHLHHEASASRQIGEAAKPAVAHRDFKSKNVLLKSDLTACIADFGLALVFEAGKPCGNTHGQVGTRRYMAPEVLEGAINFLPAAFLRIDMYACGLVLWELAARCTGQPGPVPEYRLPFEEEVGVHPSLEDMQEAVVQRRVRPVVPDHWRMHSGLAALCDTMEDCWDHDPEARLTASCVMERVMGLARLQSSPPISNGNAWRIENESPIVPPPKDGADMV